MAKRGSKEWKEIIGRAKRGEWVKYNCDYCNKENEDKKSHYKRKKRHFCNILCYGLFRKNNLDFTEQNAYKGVRKIGDTKQIYHKNYVKKNPENISHLKSRRYAREKMAEGRHSLAEWNILKMQHDNKCALCKKEKPLTKDHIIPLSKGGSDYIQNIQPLCKSCNSKKSNKIIYQHPNLLK